MPRLIDADALVAQMEADAEHMEEPIAKMFAYAAINDVKHAPTIEERKWIPCSERLPDEGVEVLCCFRNGNNYKIIVSKRTDFNYWSSVGRTGDTIAWMPLPEPYKGEQE